MGFEVLRTNNEICLNQRNYFIDLLSEYGIGGSKPVNCRVDQNYDLVDACEKDKDFLVNIVEYKKLIGKLIYMSHTRPDISYSVQFLSQYMHSPTGLFLDI